MSNHTATKIPLIPLSVETFALTENIVVEDEDPVIESVRGKLADAMSPRFEAEFDPIEAEAAGAFPEDAISEEDAHDSSDDYPHFVPLSSPLKR